MSGEPGKAADDMLTVFLAERDAPCPGCGYNLRGLTGRACPECGEGLRLGVGLAEPRIGLLIVGTVGLAAGIGFCALVGFWGAVQGARADDLLPLAAGLLVEGAVLYCWVQRRSWIRQRPPSERGALALGCWLLTILFAGWFMAVVR